MLLDKAGSKKRATRDTILGNKKFRTLYNSSSCSHTSAVYLNKKIHIFDSSKFFDTTKSNEEIRREILECIRITSSGPHAIILVMNIASMAEELKYVQHFVKMFGEKIYEHFIVLLTKKDYLDYEAKNVDAIRQTFFDKCENRVMEFDNKPKSNMRKRQVSTLLEKVSDVENKNGGRYRNEIYKKTQVTLEETSETGPVRRE